MEATLDHLPTNKQHELRSIDEAIRPLCKDVEMVILFGSYARGDYREEKDLAPMLSGYCILSCLAARTLNGYRLYEKI